MKSKQEHPLYLLWKKRSVHWFLFGINNQSNKVYFLEIVGNESTKTAILSTEEGRNLWRHLTANGFSRTELRDAGAIPFHLDQRIREWWRFVKNGFNDNLYSDDPWGSSKVVGNDAETLSGIAEGRFSKTIDDYGSDQIANFWEYIEPEEDGSDADNIHDEGENDNYWNKEGVFESESDKADEITWTTADEENPGSLSCQGEQEKEEEYVQQYDQFYQEWIAMEQERDDEMEDAIEEFYRSQEE